MSKMSVKKSLNIRDCLLCVLPILAYVSLQYRVNSAILEACLIITFFVLISIWILSVNCFNYNDFIVLLINFCSILITVTVFPGIGCALNYLNLFLCFMIFNKVNFSKKAITVAHVLLLIALLLFFMTSTYSITWNWVSFYDKNGVKINNNTVAFVLVAVYIYLSTFLLKKKKKWRYIIVTGLYIFCFALVNVLGCRSAMLFFLLYAVLALFRKRIFKKKSWRKICVVLLLISFCIPIVYLYLYNHIENFEIFGKNIFSGRENVWASAFQQIKEYPIFGSGTKFSLNDGTHGTTESTHNMLLGLWKNLGIIPAITTMFYYILNKRPKVENNLMIVICALPIIMFFESFLMDSRLYLLFLLAFPGTENQISYNSNGKTGDLL